MKAFFAREIYIRLNENEAAFVCTVKYGRFYTKATEFVVNRPRTVEEQELVLLRRRRRSGTFEDQ